MSDLVRAIEAGHDVGPLLRNGADPSERDDEGRLPIVVAAALAPADVVQALLDAGARADRGDRSGETALHAAARAGRDDVLAMLLARAPILDMPGRDGKTALLAAIAGGHAPCTDILLAAGASTTASRRCDPAIVLAAAGGSREIVATLLARGADPNAAHFERNALAAAVEGGHAAIVRTLRDAGAHERERSRLPLAIVAARRGDPETLRALADTGVDLGVRDELGRDALDHARRRGHRECVELLVSRGLDADRAHPIDRLPRDARAEQRARISRLAELLELAVEELLDVLVCPLAEPAASKPETVDLAPAHAALLAIADGLRLRRLESDDEPDLAIFSTAELDTAASEVGAPRELAPIATSSWVPHLVSVDARDGRVLWTD